MNQKTISFGQFAFGSFPLPAGYKKCDAEIKNCCGELAISAVLNIPTIKVFEKAEIKPEDLKKGTSQKRMKEILKSFGYEVKQKGVENKFRMPRTDLAVVRVSFGKPEQFWMLTAKRSHYVALKRFGFNRYVLDNVKVDGKIQWIEAIEYRKIMEAESIFITSFLELKSTASDKKQINEVSTE